MKIRLTIAQRLWIGLGLLLSLLAAAYVFTLHMLSTLDAPLAQPADDVQARRAAAAEMQTRFHEVHQAVVGYLERRDSAQLAGRKAAEARFDAALASWRRPGSGADSQALAQQVSERYGRYKTQADEAVRAADARASKQAALAGHAGELRRVTAFMPPATATKGRLRSAKKRETHNALAGQLAERAEAFGGSGGAGQAIPSKGDSIRALLGRYNDLVETRVERQWAQRAQRVIAQGDAHIAALASAAQAFERATAETSRLQQELDGLLTQRMQAAGTADLTAMFDRTAGRVRAAGALLSNGLLAALIVGALIALATSFGVRAPLRRLIASVRGYVDGDLSYRSLSMRGDEVGELRWIFDAMVGRLQNAPPVPPEQTPEARAEADGAAPEALRYAAAAFEHAAEPMLVTDGGLRTVLVNPAFTRLTGHRLEDLQGKLPSMLWSPAHHDAAFVAALWAEVDEGGTWRGELWVSDKGGKPQPLGVTIQAVRDSESRLLTTISTFRDAGTRVIAERSAAPLAYQDAPD